MALSLSSCLEPIHSKWPHLQRQIGMGVPQYLFLEIAQSFTSSSQLPNLFSPTKSGYQLTELLLSNKFCLSFVISMYQEGFAK